MGCMTTNLEVLVMESHHGTAEQVITDLQGAGHQVHGCYDTVDRGFPCKGVEDPASCPIAQGLDVAVVVRRDVVPRPTALEAGVRCALRAGLPLVEQGTPVLDPYAPWLTRRVDIDGDVPSACVDAVDAGFASLRGHIERQCVRLMARAGHVGPLQCDIQRQGRKLHVQLTGPAVGKDVEQAISVRVLDAVRADGRTHPQVDASYTVAAV
jgi:hypothetical protein